MSKTERPAATHQHPRTKGHCPTNAPRFPWRKSRPAKRGTQASRRSGRPRLKLVPPLHPNADAAGFAGIISRDPALSAGVLSVANSAVFRGVTEVETVREAVTRLGLQEVGRVAAAVAARTLFNPHVREERAAFSRRSTALFTRSVAVGSAAASVAMRHPGARSDRVYLGGLLHDVGKGLALRALARLVLDGGEPEPDPSRLERVLERVHVEIGDQAIKAWALPTYLALICSRHHDEVVPSDAEFLELHLVRLASAVAALREPTFSARAAREIVQSSAALRLDAYEVRALRAELRQAEERAAALPR